MQKERSLSEAICLSDSHPCLAVPPEKAFQYVLKEYWQNLLKCELNAMCSYSNCILIAIKWKYIIVYIKRISWTLVFFNMLKFLYIFPCNFMLFEVYGQTKLNLY